MMIVWSSEPTSSAHDPSSSLSSPSSTSNTGDGLTTSSLTVDKLGTCGDTLEERGIASMRPATGSNTSGTSEQYFPLRRLRMSNPKSSKSRRNHRCTICEHSFARAEHLIRHERLHRNEKPFFCDHCTAQFTRKDLKKRHMLKHHPEPTALQDASMTTNRTQKQVPTGSSVIPGTNPALHTPVSGLEGALDSQLPVPQSASTLVDKSSPEHQQIDKETPREIEMQVPDLSVLPHATDPHIPEHPTGPEHSELHYPFSPFDLDNFLNDVSFDPGRLSTSQAMTLDFGLLDGFSGTLPETFGISEGSYTPHVGPNFNSNDTPNSSLVGSILEEGASDPLLLKPVSISHVEIPVSCWSSSREVTEMTRTALTNEITRLFSQAGIEVDFLLPSCIALERYYTTFFDSFILHVPCVHAPTWRADTAHPSILLGMAAIGANYQFEKETAFNLHRAARLSILDYIESSAFKSQSRPVWLMQSMFFTMAYGAWSGKDDLVQETLSMQSILGYVWRNTGAPEVHSLDNLTDEDWIAVETWRRTKFIVYTFLNNLTITFNVPPILVNSEIQVELPCTAKEWAATTPQALTEYRKNSVAKSPKFNQALRSLLSLQDAEDIPCSSFGLYVMIHALLQQIWHIRQASITKDPQDFTLIESALRKWQALWAANPESSLSPHSPHGPLAFNSSTLLRLAYIRLCDDFGDVNTKVTQQSIETIAQSMRNHSCDIQRNDRRTRTALHAIHALRIPVKIGLNQVARTGMLVWSLQHYLYSFECSLFLSKWISDIQDPHALDAMTDDERKVEAVIKETLSEVDLDASVSEKPLSSKLMYAWAKMFDCLEIWGITSVLGSSCLQYADSIG